jgi:putative MATE family efflux protein
MNQAVQDDLKADALPLPSWRLVIALALPALAHQGLAFAILFSDVYLVGKLQVADQASVQAARTTAHYLAWFISCYNVLVTVGSTALVARCIGAGDRKLAIEVTHQSILLAVFLGAAATAWALLGGIRWMVDTLQLKDAAADYATDFALILFGLLIFQTIEVAGIACLVGAGDTRTGLWVMLAVAIVNIPLAWGFGRGLGPFPELGFKGVALGTALSHSIGGLAVLTILTRGRFGLKLEPRLFVPRPDLLWRILRVSVPAGFDSLSIVAGQFWFLSIVNTLGKVASSAHGIALVWEALGYLSGAAVGTAAMALVGQNLGAKRPEQAAKAGWMALAVGAGVMTLMGVIFYTFAHEMCAMLSTQPAIVSEGIRVLQLVAFAMPPLASAIIFTSALRGAGDTRVPVIFTWIGFFVVRIPLAYYLALPEIYLGEFGPIAGLDYGLYGCWLAMTADIVVRGLFFLWRFVHGAWQRQHV